MIRARLARWINWTSGALLAAALLATTAVCGAGAYYIATDSVSNLFSPEQEPALPIVAFYCSVDNSVNFAAVDEDAITRDGPHYVIAGKTCENYFDANGALQSENYGHGAFSACNRDPNSKTYPSKDPRIKKVCFLTPIRPSSMQGWFSEVGRVDAVEGLENLDSSCVTALDWCFAGSGGEGLAAIARSLDTRSVISLAHCFEGSHLEGFDLSRWDTKAVCDATRTFAFATGDHLDLSSWDVSSVQIMDEMFSNSFMQYYRESTGTESIDYQASCTEEWWRLDISGWRPNALRSYENMFSGCCVKEIDLSGFDSTSLSQNPGLNASYLRRITVGPSWCWDNVKSGSTPWYAWGTGESYGPWDNSPTATPPNHQPDTYDRSCLLAVKSGQTMTVYDVLQTTVDGVDGISGDKAYQVFQRYNTQPYDEIFEVDHKHAYRSKEELPWATAANEISSLVFASDITPASIDYWFDGFSRCTTLDARKVNTSRCHPTTALFSNCADLRTVSFGPNWLFDGVDEAIIRLPKGIWYNDSGEYPATEPLPIPGQYHRMNPIAFLTEDGTLHLSNGKELPGATFKGQAITGRVNLGFTWLQDAEPQLPWASWNYRSVVVETPLAPASCRNWFCGSSVQKADLSQLDTTGCSTLEGLFDNCEALVDITLGSNFSFTGNGAQPFYIFPGEQWTCLETGDAYTPQHMPDRTAGRYTRGLEWLALLTEGPVGEKSLRFQLRSPIASGENTEDGRTVLATYTGFNRDVYDTSTEVPWAHWANQIQAVEICDPLTPKSTSYWFANFASCTHLDLSGLDTRKCTSMAGLFDGCAATSIQLGSLFSFEGGTNERLCNFPAGVWKAESSNIAYRTAQEVPSGMADSYRTNLVPQVVYLENKELHFILDDPITDEWNPNYRGQAVLWHHRFGNLLDSAPWHNTTGYGSLNIPSNTARVIVEHPMEASSVAGWFKGFARCTFIDVRLLDVSRCTSLAETFSGCSALEELHAETWDVGAVQTMLGTFYRNAKLTSLDLSGWQPETCTSFASTFTGCQRLASLDISHWTGTHATDFSSMFLNCYALEQLNLQAMSPSAVGTVGSMFKGCKGLQQLIMPSFTVDGTCDLYCMFEDCTSLRTIFAPNWNTANCKYIDRTFSNCTSLTGQAGSTIASLGNCSGRWAQVDQPGSPGLFSEWPQT